MNDDNRLSQVLVALLQGVLYRDGDAALWQSLFELQARVRDYCATIRLRGQDDQFEVRRILKAFVDAQWLAEFEQRLAAYGAHAAEEAP
jgi:hypothetical protein